MISRIKPFLLFCLLGFVASFLPPNLFAEKVSDQEKEGALLFRDKGCAYCHGVGGEGTKKAPALTTIPKDKTWTPEKITNQILNGGQKMPPFRDSLTDEDVSNLISYLRAKNKPVPPPATSQETSPPFTPQ